MMNPAVFGIALWALFGFMVAFAIAPRFNHSVSPIPNEDDMSRNEYPTDAEAYGEHSVLTDDSPRVTTL
jgi:hypothetical protein